MRKSFLQTGLLFLLTACGQNSRPTAVSVTKDSSLVSTTANTTDTVVQPANPIEVKVERKAYKQDIKTLPPSLASFVPEGYTALDTTSGDLNLDPYPDMVLVLKKNGEDSTSDVSEHPEKRPLLLLAGRADKTYQLAARNDNAVYCIDCGGVMGDPFVQVVVKKGYFSIEHYGGSSWRWTRTTTFKFSPADGFWYLHKDGGDSFHASNPEKVTTKIRTTKDFGKLPFDQFDLYKEE